MHWKSNKKKTATTPLSLAGTHKNNDTSSNEATARPSSAAPVQASTLWEALMESSAVATMSEAQKKKLQSCLIAVCLFYAVDRTAHTVIISIVSL